MTSLKGYHYKYQKEDTHSFDFDLTLDLLKFLCAEVCSEQMFNMAGNIVDQRSR